jgi:hypothetical protein
VPTQSRAAPQVDAATKGVIKNPRVETLPGAKL